MRVIKPKICDRAICVYKYTLSSGMYYIGATTDLRERINSHLKSFRRGILPKSIMECMGQSEYVRFEFIKFVNDRRVLKQEEERYLKQHVGLPKCLNTVDCCYSSFSKDSLYPVRMFDKDNNVINNFTSALEASKSLQVSINDIRRMVDTKSPSESYVLRKVSKRGTVVPPPIKNVIRKSVGQFDINMNLISKYNSVTEAAKSIGANRREVGKVINGYSKACKGFIFKEV